MTELEHRLLAFEQRWQDRKDDKVAAIRVEFGWRPAAYYARLFRLIDDPRAEKVEPMLVHRLRRIRDERTSRRTSRVIAS